MTRCFSILALSLLLFAPRPAVGEEPPTDPVRLGSAADLALAATSGRYGICSFP